MWAEKKRPGERLQNNERAEKERKKNITAGREYKERILDREKNIW